MGNLDKLIQSTHKKLLDVESSAATNNQQKEDQELECRKDFQIGRFAHEYETNLAILNGRISNPTDEEIEQAKRDINWYENYISIAKENAVKAGASSKEIDNYSQQCKEYYEEWLYKELKNVRTVIHSDGTMTVTNTRTGEVGRFDNNYNPIK